VGLCNVILCGKGIARRPCSPAPSAWCIRGYLVSRAGDSIPTAVCDAVQFDTCGRHPAKKQKTAGKRRPGRVIMFGTWRCLSVDLLETRETRSTPLKRPDEVFCSAAISYQSLGPPRRALFLFPLRTRQIVMVVLCKSRGFPRKPCLSFDDRTFKLQIFFAR